MLELVESAECEASVPPTAMNRPDGRSQAARGAEVDPAMKQALATEACFNLEKNSQVLR